MPKPDSSFPVQISPSVLDFASADLSKSPEMEVKIKNITTSNLGIKIVDMPDGYMKVKLSDKVIKPSEEVELKVQLTREAEGIKLAKSITLELGDKNSSRFTIPVTSGNSSSKH